MGTSLWLVPPQFDSLKLAQHVMSLRTPTAKSPSSFPQFHPHVTLATIPTTPEAIFTLKAAIPPNQPPVPIRFRSVDVGQKYFMSVYVTVHHDASISALREALGKSLGEQAVPPLAHMSLFYIDDAEPDERERAREELEQQGRIIRFDDDGVALDCRESGAKERDLMKGFEGQEIWIVECDGPVSTWKVKERIALSRNA